jgi:catalase
MLFVTRWFGVTGSDAERDLDKEKAELDELVEKVLLLQSNSAAQQHRPLRRGTHAKGVCVRAQFEVLDVTVGRNAPLAQRLAKGIFAKPGVYPAVARFGNADPKVNSDFKPDVRSLSFTVDLTQDGKSVFEAHDGRQDFSLQNAPPLPINDATAFLATMKLLTASNPAVGLWKLPFKDKLRVLRVLAMAQLQAHQKVQPYQKLRYWSNVPFRHGPNEVVMQSATASPDNPARPLERSNPNGLKEELVRHVNQDAKMSSFHFALQFLDAKTMTYWGMLYDANFWTENASIKWNEAEAPFHTVGRLTLLAKSQLNPDETEATYFDVTGHAMPDSTPIGSINRARCHGEVASRKARMRAAEAAQSSH